MVFQAFLIFAFGFRLVGLLPIDPPPLPPIHSSSSAALAKTNDAASSEAPSFPARNLENSKNKKQEPKVQTLTGTVEWEYKPEAWDCDVPNCDHFALYDDASRNNFEIDDARAALPYEGKRVKVSGIVNAKNRTIHLVSIEEMK
jgi:hypothetical protein